MLKRINIIFYLLMTLFIGKGYAQQHDAPRPFELPPTPATAPLQKFLGYPVSPATGLVDVRIPIYEINTYGLNIPIELKYHSSGVRIQDPVGIVGRNWAMTPGFKISRTTMGKPDERFPVKEWRLGQSATTREEILMAANAGFNDCNSHDGGYSYDKMDGQFDIFTIHMSGLETSFILRQVNGTPTILTIPDRPYIITPKITNYQGNPTLWGFDVLDDQGITYRFGDTSLNTNWTASPYCEVSTGFGNPFYVGWMLREIVYPNSDKATFTYRKSTERYPDINQSIILLDGEEGVGSDSGAYEKQMTSGESQTWYDNGNQTGSPYQFSHVIRTITTPAESLTFDYTANNRVSSVMVRDYNGTQVKKATFSHSPVNELLTRVSLTGEGDYLFNYIGESVTLMNRENYDWWGYWNGKPLTNAFNIPSMQIDIVGRSSSVSIGFANNRHPDEDYMVFRSLNKVTYPTGGTFEISYEPHKFNANNINNRIGAGLRVRQTTSYDPVSGKREIKTYTYESPHFTGVNYPDHKSLVSTSQACILDAFCGAARQRVFSIFSRQPYFNNAIPVWYGKVTVTSSSAGKKEYTYTHTPDQFNAAVPGSNSGYYHGDMLMTGLNRLLYPEPQLLTETDYKKEGSVYRQVQQKKFTYTEKRNRLYGYMSVPVKRKYNTGDPSNCQFFDRHLSGYPYLDFFGSPVFSTTYSLETGSVQLTSVETIHTLTGGTVKEKVVFTYDTARPYNMTEKKTTLSAGDVLSEKYYYSNHTLPNASTLTAAERTAITHLNTYNHVTKVLQKVVSMNSTRISSVLTGYGKVSGNIMRPTSVYEQIGTSPMRKTLEYYNFDRFGNPRYIVQTDKGKQVVLWGYKGLYPVAEIANATYAQVTARINETTMNTIATSASPTTAHYTSMNNLRSQLPAAFVTVCKYKPLVGITSITQPRGVENMFDYNADGRLIRKNFKYGSTTVKEEEYSYNHWSESSTRSYVRTKTYTNASGTTSLEKTDYYDGLGRLSQAMFKGFTPNRKDMVRLQEYDHAGRPSKEWLPVPLETNTGNFSPLEVIYRAGYDSAYSRPTYENSSLGRVLEQYGPGTGGYLEKKPVKYALMANNATDTLSCLHLKINSPTSTVITRNGKYATGELFVYRTQDEEGRTSFEFKNKAGQTVLTRQINRSGTSKVLHDTYYVYDTYGNLRFVLPPMAVDAIPATGSSIAATETCMKQYAYSYAYDSRNRVKEKKLPGTEPIYYIYDKADRLILIQDGEQRKNNRWMCTIPDEMGRVAITGLYVGEINENFLANTIVTASWTKSTNSFKGYTIHGLELNPVFVYIINFYDNYEFMGINGIPAITDSNFKPENVSGFGSQYTGGHKRLQTGSWVANEFVILVFGGQYKVCYYDPYGQPVQIKSTSRLTDGIDKEYIGYNFTGQPVSHKLVHSARDKATQTELYNYTYDHAGRMTKKTHKLNSNATVVLAQNSYDEKGRLKTTETAGQEKLTRDYHYNVRSWLTMTVNHPHFIQILDYDKSGLVIENSWGQVNWLQNNRSRKYKYSYNTLGHLSSAFMTLYEDDEEKRGNSTSYGYDKNGNIKSIFRFGYTGNNSTEIIDWLSLRYNGNQIENVVESLISTIYSGHEYNMDFRDHTKGSNTEYSYNANGAMIKDLNKGISSISYNLLSLPTKIKFKNPVAESEIAHIYRADGTKTKTTHKWNPRPSSNAVAGSEINSSELTSSKVTEYVNNKIYEDGVLKRILIDDGYYDVTAGKYYFYIKDYLGNIRIVADINGNAIQSTEYYPYGMSFGESTGKDRQPYKFNGKELDSNQGLNLYDYGARQYDPALGRFLTMDPLAEKYYHISPYAYCANNPVNFVDPTGMSIEDPYVKKTGYNDPDIPRKTMEHLFDGLKSLFTIHLPGSREEIQTASQKNQQNQQRLENAVNTIETVNDALEMMIPGGSFIKFGLDASHGNTNAMWAAAPFLLLDGATSGKGKGLWKLTSDGASSIKLHNRFGKIYKSKSDDLWWAVDENKHGGSIFKVFTESPKGLDWYKDADQYGNFILDKHKGPVGRHIPWGELKTIK